MFIVFWHAIVWLVLLLPKLLFYLGQRIAVWSGTVYLYRRGKKNRIYYVWSALLYIASWGVIVYLFWKTIPAEIHAIKQFFVSMRSPS